MTQSKPRSIAARGNICLWLLAIVMLAMSARALHHRATAARLPLTQEIVSVDFQGTPLREALLQLGQLAGARVVIHQEELEGEGVKLSTPIYLQLRDVRLQTVFERLNLGHPASCLLDQRDLELHVTTAKSFPSIVRVYDVHDLIDRLMASPVMKEPPPAHIFMDASGEFRTHPTRQELMEQLVRLITDTLDRDGDHFAVGTDLIDSRGERLIVTCGQPLHRQIRELLERLRDAGL